MVVRSVEKIRMSVVGPSLFWIRVTLVWEMLAAVIASEIVVVSSSGAIPVATTLDSRRLLKFMVAELVEGLWVLM